MGIDSIFDKIEYAMEDRDKKKKDKVKKERKPFKHTTLLIVAFIIAAIVYLYLTLPAIHIEEYRFWKTIQLGLFVILIGMVVVQRSKIKKSKSFRVVAIALGVVLIAYFVGNVFSTKMVSSKKYASRLKVENKNFSQDMKETSKVTDIALMDDSSAQIIGQRAIGSLSKVVSQYEVSGSYTQIDYNGKPEKVAPLYYANFIRFFFNQKMGIPGYIMVDPITNEAKYVKLKKGMQYVPSAYFQKNLKRHLRLKYPSAMFEGYYFEIDNKGNPYYVCPLQKSYAGLFGARDIKGVVICDPVSGASKYYSVKDVPRWVDHVYDAELLRTKYNWKGILSNGYINSVLGQKGCREATDSYGYRVIDGDVWTYTGVTSMNGDSSNIAFVLMNMRTAETKYYKVTGADEASAMDAAEGEVQHLGYTASFPALINVAGEPTYVMILKDKGGLVKQYAMVNVKKYNIAVTATTQEAVLKEYKKQLVNQGVISAAEAEDAANVTKKITIAKLQYVPMNGNTYVYVTDTKGQIYKLEFAKDENAISWKVGDKITITFEGSKKKIKQIVK